MSLAKILHGTRFQLIAVGLLATVPVIAAQFLDRRSVEQAMVTDLRNSVVHRSSQAVSDIGQIIDEAQLLTQVISRLPEVTVDLPLSCAAALRPIAEQRPWAKAFLLARPDGMVACASDDRALAFSFGDRLFFKRAIASSQGAVGDIFVADGLPTLSVAFPLHAFDGRIVQVVVAHLRLDWVVRRALEGDHSEGSRAVLISSAGQVMGAYSSRGAPIKGAGLAAEFEAARLSANPADRTFEAVDEDGVNRVYSANPIPETSSWIAVGLSRDVANAATSERTDRAYMLAVGAALIVFLLAWVAGEFFLMRPLKAFVTSADELNSGKLDARVHLSISSTQFDAMAVAFNAMAGRLERLALEDSLTGLANRRDFDKVIADVWKRAGQQREWVAFGFIDVDKFKSFNDRYGHLAGDMVLRQIGQTMKGFARRQDDLVARYGGEEFAILLWGNDEAEARVHCEELRRAVQQLALQHEDSSNGLVSVSIGVAAMIPSAEGDPQELISSADRALYLAKSAGRNRVVSASDQATVGRPQLVA